MVDWPTSRQFACRTHYEGFLITIISASKFVVTIDPAPMAALSTAPGPMNKRASLSILYRRADRLAAKKTECEQIEFSGAESSVTSLPTHTIAHDQILGIGNAHIPDG